MAFMTQRAIGATLLLCACAAPPPSKPAKDLGDFYGGASAATRTAAEEALQDALEQQLSGDRLRWRTTDGGSGQLTPLETWKSTSGHWCRRFAETISVSGQAARDRSAVACRVDGRWRVARET